MIFTCVCLCPRSSLSLSVGWLVGGHYVSVQVCTHTCALVVHVCTYCACTYMQHLFVQPTCYTGAFICFIFSFICNYKAKLLSTVYVGFSLVLYISNYACCSLLKLVITSFCFSASLNLTNGQHTPLMLRYALQSISVSLSLLEERYNSPCDSQTSPVDYHDKGENKHWCTYWF